MRNSANFATLPAKPAASLLASRQFSKESLISKVELKIFDKYESINFSDLKRQSKI